MKFCYIAPKNLPPSIPLMTGLLWWLALDHFDAPGWLYGAVGVVWVFLVVIGLVKLVKGEAVDVLDT